MKIHEKGVSSQSNIYFHTPNEIDRKLFLFPTSCGHYFCDDKYRVYREKYQKYLILYVQDGQGYVYVNGYKTTLAKGDVFLLDCWNHHIYGAGAELEILWVHFDGMMAGYYFKAIAKGDNCVVLSFRDSQNIYNNLYNIYEQFHEKKAVIEILNNKYIVNILTDFLLGNSGFPDRKGPIGDDLLAYINDNIHLPLKLEELAARAALSPYYFTRQFKKKTSYTPHQYVLMARINTAKHYLKLTTLTLKEIAFFCGFSSEPGFCIAFKHTVGTSPTTYRGM